MAEKVLPKRSEIAPEHTWNAPSVFESDDAWRASYHAALELIPGLQRFQGKLSEGPHVLLECYTALEDVIARVSKIHVYAGMSSSVDVNNQKAAAMANQARSLHGQTLAAIAFARPELLAIGEATLKQWMADEPRLAGYAHHFDDLFRQARYVRSAEVEQILGMLADPFGSASAIAGLLTNADFKFKPAVSSTGQEIPIGQSNITSFMHEQDRELRRTAWTHYADTYLDFKNTLTTTYITSVKQAVFNRRVRGYQSTLEAALSPNNIPVEVFHNLIDSYRRHLPTWHRYWAIRHRALGVETLHPYDIWAPITSTQPAVPYTQAIEWISAGLRPLGDDYVTSLRRGTLEQRWVDIYPNEGKRAGAFSSGTQGTHPFIMMSYTDDLNGLSTLAHELGHSMHSYYTWQHQPFIYSDYSLFVAEVASNFNQAMTRAYLFNTMADPNFQIALIEEAMGNFHRYFFIMPILACFEYEVHQRIEQGKSLTADDTIALMADLFGEGYGSEMHVDRERVGITWAQFGHLYVSFYTFQYATGISGAHALADRILANEPGAADAYLNFLKAGGSGYPVDLLRRAGVDLATPEPIEKTFAVLNDLVNRLDTLTR
jgi:oligoendopeptidase F